MPTVLKKIEDFANNIAPSYATTHVLPRGVPRFIDPLLKGTTRFCRRIGNTLPTLQPQNRIFLSQDAYYQDTIIHVDTVYDGYAPGSLIKINDQEVFQIKDVDSSLLLITLQSELLVNHTAGDSVDLYAVPIYSYGPVAATTRSFYIRSQYNVTTGDQLYITHSPDLILSGTTYTITEAVPTGMSNNNHITYITIDQDLPRNLNLNDILFLRAFPQYRSNTKSRLFIPKHRRKPMYLGPFVVDYVSGRLDDGDPVDDFLDIQGYNATNVPLLGTPPPVSTVNGTYYVRASKNYPVLKVPIHASSFLFWDCIRGKVNYTQDSFVLTTDADGKAVIATELTPSWIGPQTWVCSARGITADQGTVYYRFYPNDSGVAGFVNMSTSSTLTFTLNSIASSRVEITFVGPPNSSLKWTLWTPADDIISTLEYTFLGRVTGNNIWQAGSLMIKPYFNVLADIEGLHDFDTFNGGAVMF